MDAQARQNRRARLTLLATLVTLCLALAATGASAATAAPAGQINVIDNATSSFDSFTATTDTGRQQWMRSHYYQMRGYAPYFNRALGWAPPTDLYHDLYAIYPDETTLLSQHPGWVLKDGSGRRLYIPWACDGTSCSQYAADIGNPEFRHWWIESAKSDVAAGYTGLFIDDVNLEMKVGNGAGQLVQPIDPRTGRPMSETDWQRYMAEFLEEIRAQLPDTHITHNSAWWMEHSDPYVQREVRAADTIELERGFSDPGLTGGGGKYGFLTFLANIDWLHAQGKSVILEPDLRTPAQRQFEIASYFLISDGADAICSDYETSPVEWWSGWETALGQAEGGRYEWDGLLRRDFEGGFVLVNQPGMPSRTVSLGGTYTELEGRAVDSVTLGGRQGVVLLGAGWDTAAIIRGLLAGVLLHFPLS